MQANFGHKSLAHVLLQRGRGLRERGRESERERDIERERYREREIDR